MFARILLIAVLLSVMTPSEGLAHLPPNVKELQHIDMPLPPAKDTTSSKDLFGPDLQNLPHRLASMSCDELLELPDEVIPYILTSVLLFQQAGLLPKVVGPDCMFLGRAEPIATITDPELMLGLADAEMLYHIPDQHLLLVSFIEKNAIGYGMIAPHGIDPLTVFLGKRDQAMQLADLGKAMYVRQLESALSSTTRTVSSQSSAQSTVSSDTSADSEEPSSLNSVSSTNSVASDTIAVRPPAPEPTTSVSSTSFTTISIASSLSRASLVPVTNNQSVISQISSLASSAPSSRPDISPVVSSQPVDQASLPTIASGGTITTEPTISNWWYVLGFLVAIGILYFVWRWRRQEAVLRQIKQSQQELDTLRSN